MSMSAFLRARGAPTTRATAASNYLNVHVRCLGMEKPKGASRQAGTIGRCATILTVLYCAWCLFFKKNDEEEARVAPWRGIFNPPLEGDVREICVRFLRMS